MSITAEINRIIRGENTEEFMIKHAGWRLSYSHGVSVERIEKYFVSNGFTKHDVNSDEAPDLVQRMARLYVKGNTAIGMVGYGDKHPSFMMANQLDQELDIAQMSRNLALLAEYNEGHVGSLVGGLSGFGASIIPVTLSGGDENTVLGIGIFAVGSLIGVAIGHFGIDRPKYIRAEGKMVGELANLDGYVFGLDAAKIAVNSIDNCFISDESSQLALPNTEADPAFG